MVAKPPGETGIFTALQHLRTVTGNPASRPNAARPGSALTRTRRFIVIFPSLASLTPLEIGILREAGRRGHEIYCFAPDWTERSFRILSACGATPRDFGLARFSVAPFSDERCVRQLATAFRSVKPHTVLTAGLKATVVASAAARLAEVPHLVPMLFDCSAFATDGIGASWARRQAVKPVLWWALRACTGMLVRNEADKAALGAAKLLPDHLKVTCVGAPGINVSQIPHLDLPALDHGAIFFMAADLDRRHGVLEFSEAAEILRSRARNIRFILTGGSVKGAHAFPLDELRRYRSAVQYLGPRDDIPQLIARSHVLVVPSHGMGRPDMLLAGLAMGRPIIATDTRGLPDAVEHGVNGLLVPPKDPVALAKAFSQVLQRPDLIPRMASASRKLAERKFDTRAVTFSVMNALKL